jgi:hypothetical protein
MSACQVPPVKRDAREGVVAFFGAGGFSLLVLLLADSQLAAQGTTPPSPDSQRFAAVSRIPAGRFLRVTAGTARSEGVLVKVTRDSLLLARGRTRHSLAMSEVAMVWERGSRAGKGALVGSIVGGVSLAALAISFNGLCDTENCRNPAPAALVGAAAGGLGGAVVGTLIGAMMPVWHPRVALPALR